jgi:hypothetical protein
MSLGSLYFPLFSYAPATCAPANVCLKSRSQIQASALDFLAAVTNSPPFPRYDLLICSTSIYPRSSSHLCRRPCDCHLEARRARCATRIARARFVACNRRSSRACRYVSRNGFRNEWNQCTARSARFLCGRAVPVVEYLRCGIARCRLRYVWGLSRLTDCDVDSRSTCLLSTTRRLCRSVSSKDSAYCGCVDQTYREQG